MPTKKKAVKKKEEKKAKWVPPRMAQSELRKFVLDYCDGKVYTDHQTPKNLFSVIWMVAVFMKPEEYDLKQIGFMWEYISERGPRSVNGQPIFFSAYFMHIEDAKIVGPAIDREIKRRKDLPILVPTEPEKVDVSRVQESFNFTKGESDAQHQASSRNSKNRSKSKV